MSATHVITCFLVYEEKVLLLKRSGQVGSYQQKWAGVSGYLEPGATPIQQAGCEIEEETGLRRGDYLLEKVGEPLEINDTAMGKVWVVHPFRVKVIKTESLHIDWEHSEYCWVDPEAILSYETVPGLWEAWDRVR